MFLVRMIYASRVNELKPNEVNSILEAAKRNNPRQGLTGLLCFDSDCFLQCLEGSRQAVNHLYSIITHDPRHRDAVILDYRQISKRDFAEWSMGYVPNTRLTRPMILKYSGQEVFNPFLMSGGSAHELMKELASQIRLLKEK